MKTCMRIIGTWLVPCGKPAKIKVTRNRQIKYFCEECFKFLSARRKDRVKVERVAA